MEAPAPSGDGGGAVGEGRGALEQTGVSVEDGGGAVEEGGGAVGEGGGAFGEGRGAVEQGGGAVEDGGGAVKDGRHKDTYLTRQGWVTVPKFSGMRSPPHLPLLFGWGSLVSVLTDETSKTIATTSLPLGAEPDRKIIKAKSARKHNMICSGGKQADTSQLSGKTKAECRLFTQTGFMFRAKKRAQRPTEGLWFLKESGSGWKKGMWLLERDQEDVLQKVNKRIVKIIKNILIGCF